MPAKLTGDELKTLWGIHWVASRLWKQGFDEAQTIYGQAWTLSQFPSGRRHLKDISEALYMAWGRNHKNARGPLASLARKLKKVVAKEKRKAHAEKTPPPPAERVEIFIFPPGGGPPIKCPPPGIPPPPPLPSTPSLRGHTPPPLENPSWLARLLAKLLRLPRIQQRKKPLPCKGERHA